MVNTVAQGIAFDFLVDGEGAFFSVVVEFHLGSVVAGFAVDEIADFGILNNHLGPERIARETEKVGAFIGGKSDETAEPLSPEQIAYFLIEADMKAHLEPSICRN